VTNTPEKLGARCQAVIDGAGEAIDWVAEVRQNAPRLDRDGDGLIEKLRRTRNLCRRLGTAAERPLSVGVFGMSQAGKSYLISTLARAADGQLETLLEGRRLNFIGHVNPPGGGKEATGLVTRFTRQTQATPAGFPIELSLFSEADLIKILGNTFFNDFNRERIEVDTSEDHIREHLAALVKRRQPNPTGGLTEDDMVDLLDYFEKRFEKSMAPLKADFWPAVVELAPRLAPPDRARLLSVLWGEIDALTQAYLRLRNALARLAHPRLVYVPLEGLVVEKDGELSWRADSILNVDVLDHLGEDEASPLTVLPVTANEIGPAVAVARSVLAALTAEMKFVLADPPVAGLLEHVDLLDFPGYRGRLKLGGMEEVRRQVKREDADPVAQLLLRGKVAYLFEAYTEAQEMNVLMMCTRCDQQIEITDLAPALSSWVHSTQGETPTARAARNPGLIWVITQLDRRLEAKPGQSLSQQQQEWSNMVHITLLERFLQCDWLPEWSPGTPFNNVFLVRKPGLLRSVYKVVEVGDEGQEIDFLSIDERRRLDEQRAIFVRNDNVVRYVRDPGAAWDAVIRINDGGMTRLTGYLERVAILGTKLDRIAEQLDKVTDEIAAHRLGPYYQAEGADEVAKKRAIGARVGAAVESHPDGFGELLGALQPLAEQLRRLYLRGETPAQATAAGTEAQGPAPATRKRLINLPGKGAPSAGATPASAGRAAVFARTVMSSWIKQLRELPDDLDRVHLLGLPSEVLQAITDELITASDRHRLEERLVEALAPLEEKGSTTRVRIADQQVLHARNVIDAFVDYLGLASVPLDERPRSPVGDGRIFAPPPSIGPRTLPRLPPEEIPYAGIYILDWLETFRRLAVDNAGHSAGREISPEQNLRLGAILTRLRGGPADALRP
jgi:hypothetical protein